MSWIQAATLVCFTLTFLSLLPLSSPLQAGANNVVSVTTYFAQAYTYIIWFNKYRKATRTNLYCRENWISTDGIACNEPLCNGRTNAQGACRDYIPNSHIVYPGGHVQSYPEGVCTSAQTCTCTKTGFYSGGGVCKMCSAIAHCDMEKCTTSWDQTCARCEGVVQEVAGHRAYVASSDKRLCNQACSWRSDSTRCYPGTCANELASQCSCTSGFSGKHCQTMTAGPSIVFNEVKLLTADGSTVIAPPDVNQGPSQTQNDMWTNILSPDQLYYKMETQFIPNAPAYHAFVTDAKIGVTGGKIVLESKDSSGWSLGSPLTMTCGGASQYVPERNMFTCQDYLSSAHLASSLQFPFQHGHRLDFTFQADNGGFVKVQNKETGSLETHYYTGTSTIHPFQLHFDIVNPYHCTDSDDCQASMLILSDVTTSSQQTMSWRGWMDDDAGIDHYKYNVYHLQYTGGQLTHSTIATTGEVTQSEVTITTTQAGMFSMVLTAVDKATNHKSCRRVFLSDPTSTIVTYNTPTSPLRVTTAAEVTSWRWQQTEGEVRVRWNGRYSNEFHLHNHLLAAVGSAPGVDTEYEDREGERSVASIDHVLGIVRFTTAYSKDSQGGTTLTTPADSSFQAEPDLSGTKTFQPDVKDGETLTFWVRAYDVRDVYAEEAVTVHVDSSPPVIRNLWLTKDHHVNISVHGMEELNEMMIEWEAYDEHSGLKTVTWRVYDDFSGADVLHGIAAVTPQGNTQTLAECQSTYGSYPRGPNCYCTGAAGCFHRHFQVSPAVINSNSNSHGGIFHDKNTATHDHDYYLEVQVFNHANLSTTLRKQITVDLSPPEVGAVHDGMAGSREVDYQSERELNAHWWGFIDRESGLQFYQVAFDSQCLDSAVFGHNTQDARVKLTYNTFASWEAPSEGMYYVTVVAFNRALEMSRPVCSDGVRVDSTRPSLSRVYVGGARVVGGVFREEQEGGDASLWLLDTDRTRRVVDSPDNACLVSATDDVDVEMYAESAVTSPVPGVEACAHGALNISFISSFYLAPEHHLFLNWSGSDVESGIHDYEVGLATTPDTEVADISTFTSTHQRSFYRQHHPGLQEGTPFFILLRATNRAGLRAVLPLGPVTLVRTPPFYSGSVTLTLTSDALLVTWDNALFTDVDPYHLQFSVALEEETGGSVVHSHTSPSTSTPCASTTPPSCAPFPLPSLHWGLHQHHVYRAKVKVTNVVGLDLQLTSDPYVHDTRLASEGRVYEVVAEEEEMVLGLQRGEDADYQLSTSSLKAEWTGFEATTPHITYTLGLGTQPGTDDVSPFVGVGMDKDHVFTALSLQLDTAYYVTVVATTSSGNVTVTSDGVTVIQADHSETDILVLDGPGCSAVTDDQTWSPEHHEDVVSVPCEDDVTYQLSTRSLWAHWNMTSQQRHRYPDVLYKVQTNVAGTATWTDVTTYTESPSNDVIHADGLSLQSGRLYRLAFRWCVFRACSLPVFTSGVYVIASPPVPGTMTVRHDTSSGHSKLVVTMGMWKDGDVEEEGGARASMLTYQWCLSQGEATAPGPQLTAWRSLDTLLPVSTTHVQFQVSLAGELSLKKCVRLMVRGVNRVGLTSVASSEVEDCQAVDPAPITARLVLDAVGTPFPDDPSNGQPITLGFTEGWSGGDRDYTPYPHLLSAVWPSLRHSYVTWAVLSSQGVDVTSHFRDPNAQPLRDPCSSPLHIACGSVTKQKYVNVHFGPDHSRPLLENGRHYYVCIHAEAETITYEKWTEQLPDVSVCSDGVTVDLTSPQPGTVWVDGLLNGLYQTSGRALPVRWSGFSDIEELGQSAHHSGLLSYQLAVGSVRGGQEVYKFHDVGLVNSVTLHSLRMQDGHLYYVTVQAQDHVGRTVAVSSEGFVVDTTPPLVTSDHFHFPRPFITSVSAFSLCWTDMFTDQDSGVDHYLVSLGSRPGHDDLMKGRKVTDDCGEFHTDVTMLNGHAYYVTITAVNRAALRTAKVSRPVVVMTTSDLSGHVMDGPSPRAGQTPEDVDFVTSADDVMAFWSGFGSTLSPMTSYSVRLGTGPACDDVVKDMDVGLSQEVRWSHVPLRHEVRYYTTVTACNALDDCTQVTSDGVMIDVTPPLRGAVWDGMGDEDIGYQAHRDVVGAQWRGFQDAGSGLHSFAWRVGTTPGGSDVMNQRHVGLVFSAFSKDLSSPLPEGQTVYITVTAWDAAGNQVEVSSNGFQVDSSGPEVQTAAQLWSGQGSVDSRTVVSTDLLAVRWAFTDPQSHIASQHLSLQSHLYGYFHPSPVQIPAPLTEYKFTSLTLHDGSVYNVKVTACNLAGLCTTSVTADILHDSSPPSTGMLAIETEHAADLQRHGATWMQWTSDSLTLAWVGFQDQHSGIHSYHVSVGTTPFASDLNQDGETSVALHTDTDSTDYEHEDEGFVQVYTLPTSTLTSGLDVYVTIWAVNGVGLLSHPALSQLRLILGGSLELVRRCSPFNCLSHCVCGVQGATCGPSTSCTQHTEENPNALLTVLDQDDLRLTNTPSPVTSSASYQASQSYLAATWRVTTSQGLQPIRYEISAGRSDEDTPMGVFNIVTDRVWRDVGLRTSSLIVLPQDVKLTARLAYSTFVRAWYADGSYAIFKSAGIVPVPSSPSTTTLVARAIKEHTSADSTKDVDFMTSPQSVYISWTGKFVSSTPISNFQVFIGTRPEAADIYASELLVGNASDLDLQGLALDESTVYYSTVTADGSSGLVTWDVSDGFSLDSKPPEGGAVWDGAGMGDIDYQSSSSSVSATWHGFYDVGSGVRHYVWCVGTDATSDLCDIIPPTDVGLMTSASSQITPSVDQGTTMYSKVYAQDASGQRSEVRVSDGVRVDGSGPEVVEMVYTGGVNLLNNPSFEEDTALNNNLTDCDPAPPSSWQVTEGSCVTLHRPHHTVSAAGVQHVVVTGTLQQTASGLTPGHLYRLSARLAHPHNALPNQRPVTGHVTVGEVTTPFALDPSLCVGVCDTEHDRVMLWHNFHYLATAPSPTMTVTITTTTTSPDQQLAVDDVTLEEVARVGAGGQELAMKWSGVFLAEWSVVQISWHFDEDLSPIVDYQWALGTTAGGVQLQDFLSVGRRQHASLSGLSVTHGTQLHVTVLARNAAGLTSVAHSRPLVVDMTPPVFTSVLDGETGDDVDYQTSLVISARWSVADSESSVSTCQWAVGRVSGGSDVQPFQTAIPTAPGTFTVSANVTDALAALPLPLTVHVSVRCYNMAGRPARAATDGVTIVADDDSQQMTPLTLLPDGVTHYPVMESCRAFGDRVRMHWGEFASQVPVVGFEVATASSDDEHHVTRSPELPFLLSSALLNLTSSPLSPRTPHNFTVQPVTVLGDVTSGATSQADVLPEWPEVTANGQITSSLSGSDLTLSWPDLFHSDLDLSYEVTAGSVVGGGDIIQWQKTQETNLVISLAHAKSAAFKMNVVVTAVDPCGQFAHFVQSISVQL
ncbi:uncharacterized protein LOC143299060 [Babylonia areolata]|uniref:uncharacterized protein LOC143299060 n=1 Tax=Babylonia areolata TaxID=304850 RepID=UPI003FD0021A